MCCCILTVSFGAGCTDTAGLHPPPQLKPAFRKDGELFNLERSQRHHLSFQALDVCVGVNDCDISAIVQQEGCQRGQLMLLLIRHGCSPFRPWRDGAACFWCLSSVLKWAHSACAHLRDEALNTSPCAEKLQSKTPFFVPCGINRVTGGAGGSDPLTTHNFMWSVVKLAAFFFFFTPPSPGVYLVLWQTWRSSLDSDAVWQKINTSPLVWYGDKAVIILMLYLCGPHSPHNGSGWCPLLITLLLQRFSKGSNWHCELNRMGFFFFYCY